MSIFYTAIYFRIPCIIKLITNNILEFFTFGIYAYMIISKNEGEGIISSFPLLVSFISINLTITSNPIHGV